MIGRRDDSKETATVSPGYWQSIHAGYQVNARAGPTGIPRAVFNSTTHLQGSNLRVISDAPSERRLRMS
jgi:hypothetical protein